ncbi:MAG: hypothetical protein IJ802_01860, partial [Kiritimatiellae bacterium]|nr:hypothetical protein [Kiritimatiellia bacterium]
KRMENTDDPWPLVAVYAALAVFAGWLQEAFSLPVLCAMAAYRIVFFRQTDAKKLAVLLCYAAGVFLLVRIAGGRAGSMAVSSADAFAMSLVKIAAAVKAVWLLLAVFLFSGDKRGFVRRNLFEFFAIGASIAMIAIIGFTGERSLYAANMFAVVLVVREARPSVRVASALALTLVATLGVCCVLGCRIKCEFEAFEKSFLESPDGLCRHDRVDCGIFARFFHQCVYTWEDGVHGRYFALFHGRTAAPCALSGRDLAAIRSGEFCTPQNRLPLAIEAYTLPSSNTILLPLADADPAPQHVKVEYDFPKGFFNRILRQLASRKNPPVGRTDLPRTVELHGKRYAFVAKMPESDKFIRSITFID